MINEFGPIFYKKLFMIFVFFSLLCLSQTNETNEERKTFEPTFDQNLFMDFRVFLSSQILSLKTNTPWVSFFFSLTKGITSRAHESSRLSLKNSKILCHY
jgi:hypothetical protein